MWDTYKIHIHQQFSFIFFFLIDIFNIICQIMCSPNLIIAPCWSYKSILFSFKRIYSNTGWRDNRQYLLKLQAYIFMKFITIRKFLISSSSSDHPILSTSISATSFIYIIVLNIVSYFFLLKIEKRSYVLIIKSLHIFSRKLIFTLVEIFGFQKQLVKNNNNNDNMSKKNDNVLKK